jgi:hypothetical protein
MTLQTAGLRSARDWHRVTLQEILANHVGWNCAGADQHAATEARGQGCAGHSAGEVKGKDI